jgi:hypothetical protein
MATLKQTAFRLDVEDFAILDAVKHHMGFSSRSDALRYVLRDHARREGLDTKTKTTRQRRR